MIHQSRKDGFITVAALGLGAILAASYVIVLGIKSSIELESRHNAVKHARFIAEDILKTQLAIKINEIASRTDLETYVNSLAAGFRVPIPGSNCGGDACSLVLLSYDEATPSGPSIPSLVGQSEIYLRVGIDPAQASSLNFQIEPLKVKLKLPTQAELQSATASLSGSYLCNADRPIFKGLVKNNSTFVPVCESPVVDAAKATISSPVRGEMQVLCKIGSGLWMRSLDAQLSPVCDSFATHRSPASVDICENPSTYPSFFELNSNFNVNSSTRLCLPRGSPYDYAAQEP